MDIRAPRANRGAGFKSQGCYRPDAVSARPMGHLSRRSLSISQRNTRIMLASGRRYGRKGHVVMPDGPDDPPEFVRDGDRGFVVASPRLHR